jgi:hypothetical protein
MTKKIKKLFIQILAPVTAWLLPAVAYASGEINTGLSQIRSPFISGGAITSSTDLVQMIAEIIRLLLIISGAVAVLFVVVGGFWYLTSAGNEEQAEKGKNTVVNAIIGIVIIILAYVIINAVVGTLNRY